MGGPSVTYTDRYEMLTLKRDGLSIPAIAKQMGRSAQFIRKHMPTDSEGIAMDSDKPNPQPFVQPEQDAVPDILTMIRDLVNYCEKLQAENTQHMLAIEKLERENYQQRKQHEATSRHWLELVESAKAHSDTQESLMARAERLMQPTE